MAAANAPDGEVIFSVGKPIMPDGGVAVLKGNLCPDGAVIKVAGLKNLVFEGTARVFEDEEHCVDAVRNRDMPRATSSSSATRARSAVPVCARCSASPR